MKILLIILGIAVVIAAAVFVFIEVSKPKQSDYTEGLEPRIVEKTDTTILKVPFLGDADVVITAAYKDLFKAYYGCKGVPRGPKQPPTLARYAGFDAILDSTAGEQDVKALDWEGFVAIPVPSGTVLPDRAPAAVSLELMDYGTVAEIVHFGSYETEHENIRRLLAFIDESGYAVNGLHEEEYILGPGTPLSRPKDYITVIRYQVEKR